MPCVLLDRSAIVYATRIAQSSHSCAFDTVSKNPKRGNNANLQLEPRGEPILHWDVSVVEHQPHFLGVLLLMSGIALLGRKRPFRPLARSIRCLSLARSNTLPPDA